MSEYKKRVGNKGNAKRIAAVEISIIAIMTVVTASAQSFLFSIPSGQPALTGATGVAVDGSGNIYVAQAEVKQVVKLSPDGSEIWRIGTLGFGDGQFRHVI